jgi:hypothetical protein
MLPLVVPLPTRADGVWVWSVGAGSELYQGLGAVVLGGLIVSTFFTLILIPAGFSLVMDVVAGIRTAMGTDAAIAAEAHEGRARVRASES